MTNWKKYYLRFVGAAVLNAAAFVSYRVYMATLKKRLKPSDFKAVYNRDFKAIVSLNFINEKELLQKFQLAHFHDGVDDLTATAFELNGVPFTLQKYQQSPKYHYNIYVDLKKLGSSNEGLRDFIEQALVALELSSVPVIWTQEGLQQLKAGEEK